MNRFSFTESPLAGLGVVERKRMTDDRGFLSRLFCADELSSIGWNKPIVQINHTYTREEGTVRGLHFQYPPHGEMKLVSVTHGEIWDVAVDLRAGSATYLHWYAEVLSADAFSRFEENGIFDPASGQDFLHNILERGGSEDAMDLFVRFRGREPEIDALLRHSGIAA